MTIAGLKQNKRFLVRGTYQKTDGQTDTHNKWAMELLIINTCQLNYFTIDSMKTNVF